MYGNNTIVFCNFFRKGDDLILFGVPVRFVHESERSSECTAFHRLAHVSKFFFDLLFGIRRRIISGHARSYRTLADQRHQIHKQIALCSPFELRKAARMHRVEQTSADLVPVGRILIDSERREAAVSRDLRRYALLYEGLVELL